MMRIDIVTLFPEICLAPLRESMMGRAQTQGLLELHAHDLRAHGKGKYRQVDDEPYGGGPGMVMKPEPYFEIVEALRQPHSRVLLMTPQGRRFDQSAAARLAASPHLILLCGHYEGVDHRVVEQLVDEELSIGDYVLTNGALAAAVVVDAVVRLIPEVLGHSQSALEESFSTAQLDWPQYTRPLEYRGQRVPDILLSGHHAAVAQWRRQRAAERTRENRPDLLG